MIYEREKKLKCLIHWGMGYVFCLGELDCIRRKWMVQSRNVLVEGRISNCHL